uniref:MT domain-containing protein n=1 Tax=Rhabditophanes sp. KR3021 TaxID=114890 RepID=A0AC35TNE7_9BILA
MFKDKFFILPMPKVDKNNLQQIVEYIYEWHLEVRSFSSEYQSLAEPFGKVLIKLFEGSEYILPGILKVVKGLLFAATESAPDLDSMTRLFVHELLRVLYDELPKESRKTKLLAKINNAISTYCHTSLETLFPKENDVQLGSNIDASGLQENHELNFYDKQAKSENLHIPSTFKIKELLFTEISNNHDVMEGIPYYPNFDLSDFIRHLSNLVFEFSRLQNLKKPINIVVTPKYAANIQKVMRVIRMSNEHVAIVGDCGVSSCVKLANFAVVGHIEHVYISTTTIEQFQASWMKGVARCTEYVVSTNLPVTLLFHFDESIFLIPTHWLLMLKQWFESYNVSEILSDDAILKLGEVGGDLSSEILAIELDDEELSFLMLSRELNRGKEKIVELERSLLTLEDENKKLVEESTNHSHLIKGIMDEPLAALESVNRILLAHPYENFRQLSFIKKPSVMIREVVDAVRMLLQKDYKPKKKSIDSWVCCQPFIRTKNLIDKLCNFDVNNVVDKQLLNVKRYTEFKLYKVNQMADESTLAADLCKWTMAIVAAIGANKHVQENKQIMSKLMSEAALLQSNILEKKNDLNKLKVRVKKLEDDTRTCEYEVTKLRKYLDYRVRGTKIVNCIMSIRSSWQQKHDIIKGMMDDLLGNTLIYAAFYTLSSHLGSDMKLRAMNGWKLIIAGNGIKYNDKFCDSDYFIKEALIETSWANAWPLICPEIQKKNTGTPRESQIEIIKNKILEFFPKAVVIDMKMSDGKHERKTSSDLRIDSSETTLAEMENRWLKRDVVDPTNGALRNGYQLIFLNIECSPPSEWMHLIEREMEQVVIVDRKRKDDTSGTIQPNQTQITLQFCGQTLVVNKSFKLFMVPSTEINLIERRLFRKVWPLTLNEGMDLQSGTNYPLDNEIVQHLSSQFEEAFILQKLNDYTANDILDSQDMTDQIIRNGTILLTNHARIY